MEQKIFKKIDIQTKQLVNTLFLWNYTAAFKGRGIEFHDFREYADGDDAKLIDWLVSAREWKTIIRRYREERELEVGFVLDVSHSMYFWDDKKKIDTLKEFFYILGYSAIKNGDKLWAYIVNGNRSKHIPYKKWNISLLNIFHSIPDNPWSEMEENLALDFLIHQNVRGKLLFIVTDKLDVTNKNLRWLNLHNDVVYIHVSDIFENTLQWSWIKLLQGARSRVSIDLDNMKKKESYIQMRQAKIGTMKSLLFQNNIDSLFIDNTDNLYKKILQLMRTR